MASGGGSDAFSGLFLAEDAARRSIDGEWIAAFRWAQWRRHSAVRRERVMRWIHEAGDRRTKDFYM